jgi:NAD+ kinase
MAERLSRIGVLTHTEPGTAHDSLRRLAGLRHSLGLDLMAPQDEHAKHPELAAAGYREVDDAELRSADLCLVFGGDGTILRSLGRLLGSPVPTLGVNFGNVGFLAGLSQDGWPEALAKIVAGEYREVELLTVEARHQGQRFSAVNDVVLDRAERRHVLHLEYEVLGTYVGRMLCDGMIIATPAGSTAYNLSCDGPLVVWDARVMVLNFIAPHSLGFRPVVLRPDHVIRVQNVSPLDEAEIIVDGRVVGTLCCGEEIEISAAPERARLLIRGDGSFYQNVEEKLFDRSADAR